jgi:NAD(P)H-dependent flavin oxidoreductase YrpB (nitropropane dioxygenase family)
VSNFGGLGSFGAHGLTPQAIQDVIAEIRSLTSKPFAMNLWVSMEDEGARTSDEAVFHRSLGLLAPHLAELGASMPSYKPYSPVRFEDQVRVLLDAHVPVFSFIVGIPPKEILDECRAKSIVTIGTATTPDEAIALEAAGVDAIVASGFEAGGHRGSFLRSAEESLMGTFSLVPQVADIVGVPVIAAGGIGDARGVVAAMALGADAVQIGTAFLACEESGASRLHREALRGEKARYTGLTRVFPNTPMQPRTCTHWFKRFLKSLDISSSGKSRTDRRQYGNDDDSRYRDDEGSADFQTGRRFRDRRTCGPGAGSGTGANQGTGLRHLPQRRRYERGDVSLDSVPPYPWT